MKMLFGHNKVEYYEEISLKLSIYHGACAVNYFHERSKEPLGPRSEEAQELYANASTLLRMRNDINDSHLMYTEEDKVAYGQIVEYYKFLGLVNEFFHKVEKCIDMDDYMKK